MLTDIQDAVAKVNAAIVRQGFVARDADGNDFQRGTDRDLRFKTGCSYGEVAVQIVRQGKANANETIRVLNDKQIGEAMVTIGEVILNYDHPAESEVITDGNGKVLHTVECGNPNHPWGC